MPKDAGTQAASGVDFERLFDAAPMPYLVLSPVFEIIAVNDAYLRATGTVREKIVGRPLFDVFPDNPEDPAATGVANLRASLMRVLETRAPHVMRLQKYDIPVEGGFEERYWDPVNTPVLDVQGEVMHIIHQVEDVTARVRLQARIWSDEELGFIREAAERTQTASERLQSELALRESESMFRTITNAMPQIVWSTRANGYHDYYNRQWYDFTGVPEGSTDGAEWNGMFHPEDQEEAWKVWRHSLATGETYEIQYRLRHRSGEYRWVLGRALPVRDEANRIVRWMGTCTDIHDQKLAEQKLRETDRRKDEFLAMLAHELRNPLAPISAAAQLLQMPRLDAARIYQTSEIIGRQVSHMTHLVDDLLDVSRVTRGLVKLDMAPVDITHIVTDAVEQVSPLVRSRGHHLTLQLAPQTTIVTGDKKRLVQVIANIVNNAAKYTPEGGHILLKTEVRDKEVAIDICDDGIGMAPDLVMRVFDLFSQAERTSDRSSGGLGLGLALVKSLVELHGGKVACSSDGPGRGSRFTVCLPRLPEQQGQAGSDRDGQRLPAAARALRIMVVDDNADAAAMIAMLLQASGHDVLVEHGSLRALERSRTEAPDVFLLDIGLPEMDGNELAQRLRAQPETARAVIIAVTGYGQEADRRHTLAAGFDHHMVKPVDTRKLAAILAKIGSP